MNTTLSEDTFNPAHKAQPLFLHDARRLGMAGIQRRQRLQADMIRLLRHHQQAQRYWLDQLLRQSAQLLIERARADWGLLPGIPARPLNLPPQAAAWVAVRMPQAHALICRTGCAMDNDHWRDGDQCRRTGLTCDGGEGESP